MYKCLDCTYEFSENEAEINEYGTGSINSKVELLACPDCGSQEIKDIDTGKIQGR